MGQIIACIDGSEHADHVCHLSGWVAQQTSLPISLLHVVSPHSEFEAKGDLSGSIGLGAKSELREKLTEMDEERAKLELQKGQLMLDHAKETLASLGINQCELMHRRGSLVETLAEYESNADIVIIGKRGEQAKSAPNHLGSNLERVARSLHKPLLIANNNVPTNIKRFLIAFDGSPASEQAITYIVNNTLLKGLECHLLTAGKHDNKLSETLGKAEKTLSNAGFSVTASLENSKPVDEVITDYVNSHNIDLLVMGAYGHSKIRSLILGSTTSALIRKSSIPLLLCR